MAIFTKEFILHEKYVSKYAKYLDDDDDKMEDEEDDNDEEEEDDDDNEHESLDDGVLHLGDRGTDESCVIEAILILHILGEVFLHHLHTLIHCLGNVDVVGTRLRNHYHTHHGHTIHLHVALDVAGAELGTTDIAEADDVSVLLLDDEVIELLGGVHQAERTDREFYGVTLDTS